MVWVCSAASVCCANSEIRELAMGKVERGETKGDGDRYGNMRMDMVSMLKRYHELQSD